MRADRATEPWEIDPVDVLTTDGSVARIRQLEHADEPALRDLHARASDASVRFRFFSASRHAAENYVDHLLREDDDTLTLVTTLAERLVAVATAEPVVDRPDTLEVAFLVDDAEHGRGLGSLLLEHLASLARRRGVRRFVADVLGDNLKMRRVFHDAGFSLVTESEAGITHLEMDLTTTARVLETADAREAAAERLSLRPLLYPRSVVVLGARRDGSGIGAAVLRSIQVGGFTGEVHVVHPQAASGIEIRGVRAVASCSELPGPVDLAVVAVPARATATALRDVVSARIPAAIVLSSGFGEMGSEGVTMQRELAEIARRGNVRLVGPNCLGLMSNGADLRLNATFSEAVPPPGGLAVASQSGGVGIVLLDRARRSGLGVRSFVSLGNKADVSGNDLLAAWLEDPEITAAGLYLESFGNARKFARLARRFSRVKPLLAVVGGRSEGGRRAGASHTAAAAADGVVVDAMFAQTGIIRCDGADDLAETALLLDEQPRPGGSRLGILTNAGGIGVLAADLAEREGLVAPSLSPATVERLSALLRASSGSGNPVDTGAGASAADLGAVTDLLLACGEVDTVLVVMVATGVVDPAEVLREVGAARRRHPEVPAALVVLGAPVPDRSEVAGFTLFEAYDDAVAAIGKVARYAAWAAAPHEEAPPRDLTRAVAARSRVTDLLERADPGDTWLGQRDIQSLLADYGLMTSGVVVRGTEAAVEAAVTLGLGQGVSVAVKVADPEVLHKTERGLVAVGLSTRAQVRGSLARFREELGRTSDVMVQPMASGIEVAVGLVRDPVFGPLVMVAAGGVGVDVWNDRVFLMAPVSRVEAARAVRSLRIWPLLAGHRGAQAGDVSGLEEIICAVGRLGDEVPQVAELDLNPVLVGPSGCVLVDARLRLATAEPTSSARALGTAGGRRARER